MTAGPYDEPLSALPGHADGLAAWVAIWEARAEPDAHARRCADDAISAIDQMLRDPHAVCARLASETRQADDDRAAAYSCNYGSRT